MPVPKEKGDLRSMAEFKNEAENIDSSVFLKEPGEPRINPPKKRVKFFSDDED